MAKQKEEKQDFKEVNVPKVIHEVKPQEAESEAETVVVENQPQQEQPKEVPVQKLPQINIQN